MSKLTTSEAEYLKTCVEDSIETWKEGGGGPDGPITLGRAVREMWRAIDRVTEEGVDFSGGLLRLRLLLAPGARAADPPAPVAAGRWIHGEQESICLLTIRAESYAQALSVVRFYRELVGCQVTAWTWVDGK